MSQRDSNDFNWRVVEVFTDLIERSGMTRAEVITRSGMRRNTFFVKMRGETPLTTDDIAKLAGAFGLEPEIVMREAVNNLVTASSMGNVTPMRPIAEEPNWEELDAGQWAAKKKTSAEELDPDRD